MDTHEAEKLAASIGCSYYETSAVSRVPIPDPSPITTPNSNQERVCLMRPSRSSGVDMRNHRVTRLIMAEDRYEYLGGI